VDADLVAAKQIAELDLGTRALRRDRLLPADLIRSLVPTLQSIADQHQATLAVDIEPLLPAIRGDQPQLQDALAAMIGSAIRGAGVGAELQLTASRDERDIRIELRRGGQPRRDLRWSLAERLIAASGGSVSELKDGLLIRFPRM